MVASRVYVSNLAEVRRHLRRIEPELLPEMRKGLKAAVDRTVVPAAKARVAKRSGRAANTLRSVAGGNRGIFVAGGGARAPYYPWLDFGGTLKPVGKRRNTQTRPFIKRGRYIYPALDATMPAVTRQVEIALGRVLNKLNR
jgi:hypothetical protein